jgi:hypothetical protein
MNSEPKNMFRISKFAVFSSFLAVLSFVLSIAAPANAQTLSGLKTAGFMSPFTHKLGLVELVEITSKPRAVELKKVVTPQPQKIVKKVVRVPQKAVTSPVVEQVEPALIVAPGLDTSLPSITSSPVSTMNVVSTTVMVTDTLAFVTVNTVPFQELVSTPADDRPDRLDKYFEKYKMPLAGYGEKFVEVADSCGIDWRLLPAISVQESTGGKYMRLNNPFGWASARIGFTDFDEAIEVVGTHLCGLNERTASYYKNKTTYQKLWSYNGTVNSSYPSRVMAIMEKF